MPGEWWSFGELNALWDLLSKVRRWLKSDPAERTSEAAAKQPRQILILGPGGVGKTTFARLLSGEAEFRSEGQRTYEESIAIETYSILEDRKVELLVLPGQRHRRVSSWAQALQSIQDGQFRGVVLFSAFGHHSLGEISFKSHELYEEAGRRKPGFLSRYLESNRQDELEVIRQLRPFLETSGHRVWMLSVVAKQDLCWNERQSVEQHYRRGEYGEIISRIAASRSDHSFQHEFAFASLVIQNLTTGQGELLKKNIAGFDHPRQVASLKALIATLNSLLEWEHQRWQ